MRDLLASLDPAHAERRAGKGAFDFLPGRGPARRWAGYQAPPPRDGAGP
ncbi:MAG: hypothetical protein WDN49_08785 [Acetobacteraceae bacterium]